MVDLFVRMTLEKSYDLPQWMILQQFNFMHSHSALIKVCPFVVPGSSWTPTQTHCWDQSRTPSNLVVSVCITPTWPHCGNQVTCNPLSIGCMRKRHEDTALNSALTSTPDGYSNEISRRTREVWWDIKIRETVWFLFAVIHTEGKSACTKIYTFLRLSLFSSSAFLADQTKPCS